MFDGDRVDIGLLRYVSDYNDRAYWVDRRDYTISPTHWMPLPKGPEAQP